MHRRYIVKYEKIKKRTALRRRRSVYRDDRKNSHAVRSPGREAEDEAGKKERKDEGGRKGGKSVKNALPRRTHFLPHEDVVDHGASAEHDAEANEDRRDDRWRRVELDERVQDHAYG